MTAIVQALRQVALFLTSLRCPGAFAHDGEHTHHKVWFLLFSTAFIAMKQTGCAVLQLDQTLGLHLKNWVPSILLAVLAPKTAPDSATSFRIGFVQTGQCMPQVLPQDQANPITNVQCFKILARNFVEGIGNSKSKSRMTLCRSCSKRWRRHLAKAPIPFSDSKSIARPSPTPSPRAATSATMLCAVLIASVQGASVSRQES